MAREHIRYTWCDRLTTEYVQSRSDRALRLQLAARLAAVEDGVNGEIFYDRAMGTSLKLRDNADAADRLFAEIELRNINI